MISADVLKYKHMHIFYLSLTTVLHLFQDFRIMCTIKNIFGNTYIFKFLEFEIILLVSLSGHELLLVVL